MHQCSADTIHFFIQVMQLENTMAVFDVCIAFANDYKWRDYWLSELTHKLSLYQMTLIDLLRKHNLGEEKSSRKLIVWGLQCMTLWGQWTVGMAKATSSSEKRRILTSDISTTEVLPLLCQSPSLLGMSWPSTEAPAPSPTFQRLKTNVSSFNIGVYFER